LNKVKKELIAQGAPRAEIRKRELQITNVMARFNQTVERKREETP
jgi:hypothetical protein